MEGASGVSARRPSVASCEPTAPTWLSPSGSAILSLRRDKAAVTGGGLSKDVLEEDSRGGDDGGQDGLLEKTSEEVVGGGLEVMDSGDSGLFPAAAPPKYLRTPFILR